MTAPIKLFFAQDANALLPQIDPLVRKLREVAFALHEVQAQLDGVAEHSSEALTMRQQRLGEEFEETLERLEGMGCLLKDVEEGLVDFYTLRDADLVFLCWRLGEPSVQHWHRVDDGFGGRQPL